MNKKALFAFSLVTLISLTSCEKAPKQKKVDRDTFFEEAAKIEEYKYDYAIVHVKEKEHTSHYDGSSSLTSAEDTEQEYFDLYFYIKYEDVPETNQNLFDIFYEIEYDSEKSKSQEIGSVKFSVMSSITPYTNLQNDRYVASYCTYFTDDQLAFYTNPLALVICLTEDEPLGYSIEFEEHGFPRKMYSKTMSSGGHGEPGGEVEESETVTETWLDVRYE